LIVIFIYGIDHPHRPDIIQDHVFYQEVEFVRIVRCKLAFEHPDGSLKSILTIDRVKFAVRVSGIDFEIADCEMIVQVSRPGIKAVIGISINASPDCLGRDIGYLVKSIRGEVFISFQAEDWNVTFPEVTIVNSPPPVAVE